MEPRSRPCRTRLHGGVADDVFTGDAKGAYSGADSGERVHRYNFLKHEQIAELLKESMQCKANKNCNEVQEKYRKISLAQQDELIAICATSADECHDRYQALIRDSDKARKELEKLSGHVAGYKVPWRISLDAGALLLQYTEAEDVISQAGLAKKFKQRYGLNDEQASIISAAALSAMGAVGPGKRSKISAAPEIKWSAQEKHFPGHNSYILKRSVLTSDPTKLASKAGTGQQVGNLPVGVPGSKERIKFDEVIGKYFDNESEKLVPTRNGIVHYAKDGIRIAPTRP